MKFVLPLLSLSAVFVGGCATNATKSQGGMPPAMVSTVRPDLRFPRTPTNGTVLDLRIAVEVDSLGQPIMRTLQVTGLGAADNRDVIERWIEIARYRPARQGGRDVNGVFKTRVQLRGEVRTVRRN